MKKFTVALTKSYEIEVEANNVEDAKKLTELFTGDITDISTEEDRKKYNFKINNIECTYNDALSGSDESTDIVYDEFNNV
jgi:hypothetical protein